MSQTACNNPQCGCRRETFITRYVRNARFCTLFGLAMLLIALPPVAAWLDAGGLGWLWLIAWAFSTPAGVTILHVPQEPKPAQAPAPQKAEAKQDAKAASG